MLVLVMGLLYWTQAKAFCTETRVTISGDSGVLPAGENFKVTCEFVCLRRKHVAQLWRDYKHQGAVVLVNITSAQPNVTLDLNINSAKADSGYYSCMTHPPDTISPSLSIQISDNLTIVSTPESRTTQVPSTVANIQGQMWYWMLLGKIAILLLSLVSLAVKRKRR